MKNRGLGIHPDKSQSLGFTVYQARQTGSFDQFGEFYLDNLLIYVRS